MKILFLNLWHGKLAGPLQQFLTEHADTDVFCFQEADENIALPEFVSSYQRFAVAKHLSPMVSYVQAIYVHPRYRVDSVRALLQADPEVGLALALRAEDPQGNHISLVNIHGVARAWVDGQFQESDEKQDFPARLRQFETLRDFVQNQVDPVIAGGDFNVLPDTESIEMFRRAGYRDLIHEYAIPTTRNHFAWDAHPSREPYYFSDYAFTTPIVKIRNFSVPTVEISDHLPLILEIE